MRVAIITQDAPLYLPAQIDRVLSALGGDAVAVIILPPLNASAMEAARRLFGLFGLWAFLGLVRRTLAAKLSGSGSVARMARKHGVAVYRPEDVNSLSFLKTVRQEMKPDVIVSLSATQVLKKELLEAPRKGCINVHSALLPNYRGHMPCFQALLNGEETAGVTVHFMDEAIDRGDIILQAETTIGPDESLDSLIRRTKQMGADLVLKALKLIDSGCAPRQRSNPEEGSYFSFPGREEGRRFREMGKRFW